MDRAQQTEQLTGRQREVLRLVERGHTNGEIAEQLGISLQGVKWHVRELLGKLGAESREELIERAHSRRGWANTVRWFRGGAALAGIKAVAIGGTAIVAGAGIFVASTWNGRDDPDALSLSETTPTVQMLSPAPLPSVTGSIWTPEEALRHARQQVGADIGASSLDSKFDRPINLDDYVVTQFEWMPGADRYDFPDGDRYWATEDGRTRDLWLVQYRGSAYDKSPQNAQTVDVAVFALVEDGATAKAVQALSVDVVDRAGNPVGAGGGDFRLKSMDARMSAMVTPRGPEFTVARANGAADGPALNVFQSEAGSWCMKAQSLECGIDPARPSYPLIFGVGSGFNGRTGEGHLVPGHCAHVCLPKVCSIVRLYDV